MSEHIKKSSLRLSLVSVWVVPGRCAPNPVRPLSRFTPNPVRPLSRFAPIPVRPGSFCPDLLSALKKNN